MRKASFGARFASRISANKKGTRINASVRSGRFGFYRIGGGGDPNIPGGPLGPSRFTPGDVGIHFGSAITSAPIFYDIRYFTPDKFYFPRDEREANSVWRLIYERDPVVGAAIDLYAEFAWGEFDLLGIDDPYVKGIYEAMVDSLNLLARLPDITKDFLILGKAIPHLVFSERDGYWKYLLLHDPNALKITFIPVLGAEPIIDLKPNDELRKILNSPDPRIRKIVERLSPSLRHAIQAGMPIPLDNIYVSYIARRIQSSDLKGTSLLTRIYRMLMYEDFLMNAALAVAQRNAVPLRLFKLGDPETGWFPTPDDEEAFAELLSIAEADPLAALIFHRGVEVEYVGVSDKFWKLSGEWDFIEELKLLGLGVSKSFLVGEASFASAVAGLQTFVQRVAALRMKIEKEWLLPKVFATVAKINGFYKRKQSELDHRIRIKKEEKDLIIPHIRWKRSLEPTQETSILSVWESLHEKGLISDRTLLAGAGLNIDVERDNIKEELK